MIELDRMLQRVVGEVFGPHVDVTYSADAKSPHVHRAELAARGSGRRVGLRASYGWFDITMLDLGFSATLFDEDDEERDKEAALRALALVARAISMAPATSSRSADSSDRAPCSESSWTARSGKSGDARARCPRSTTPRACGSSQI